MKFHPVMITMILDCDLGTLEKGSREIDSSNEVSIK